MTINAEHQNWLRSRRLDPTQCARNGMQSHGRNLSFDFLDEQGRLLFRKLRTPDKSFWIEPKGAPLRLWGLDRLEAAWLAGHGDTLVITEGELDAEAVIESGFGNVASVPNGAPSRPGQGVVDPGSDTGFSYLWGEDGLRVEVARPERIILFTDNDEPGHILRDELALRLGPERCYVVAYPDGCKDANDVKIKLGPDAVLAMIEAAQPIVPSKLTQLHAIPKSAIKQTYLSGWTILDPHLRLTFPELLIVTGKPGHGKSEWTQNYFLQIARHHKLPGAFIQFEDDIERLRRQVHYFKSGFKLGEDWDRDLIHVVQPSVEMDDTRDLAWLYEVIAEAAVRHNCRWIVIDPWNELEHMYGRDMTAETYLNKAIKDLKRLGRRYNLAICIVAHPDKHGGRNESIDDMTLYSISGGATWRNKADGGIIIERVMKDGKYTNDTLIKIDKRKDQQIMGVPGMTMMHFNTRTRVFAPGPASEMMNTSAAPPDDEGKSCPIDGGVLQLVEGDSDEPPFSDGSENVYDINSARR